MTTIQDPHPHAIPRRKCSPSSSSKEMRSQPQTPSLPKQKRLVCSEYPRQATLNRQGLTRADHPISMNALSSIIMSTPSSTRGIASPVCQNMENRKWLDAPSNSASQPPGLCCSALLSPSVCPSVHSLIMRNPVLSQGPLKLGVIADRLFRPCRSLLLPVRSPGHYCLPGRSRQVLLLLKEKYCGQK